MLRKTLLLLLVIPVISCEFRSAESYVKQAHEIGLKGDYTNAIKLYDKAIKIDPKLKEAYLEKGLCLEYLHKYNAATKAYNSILQIDSANTIALFSIGLCNSNQNKFIESISYYNKALVTKGVSDPNDTFVHLIIEINRNGILGDQARFDVESSQIYYERGYSYYCTSQFSKAFRDFTYCISNNYNLGSCYYLKGLCWLNSNSKNKSEEAYKSFKMGAWYGDSLSKIEMNKLSF